MPNSAGECWCEGIKYKARRLATVEEGPRIVDGFEFCPCSVGELVFETEQERIREREARRLYERRQRISERKDEYVESCGIPLRFWDYTLDGSPLAQSHNALVKALLESGWDESWYLWGKHGTGKTGLAAAYAKQFLRLDDEDLVPEQVIFRAVPDLFTELRASYNPRRESDPTESELLEKYTGATILVLDDIGAEQIKDSGWLEDRLYQIIGKRHAELASVFITSNLSPAELGNRIGERIMWRIVEMCGADHIVEVKGANQRDRGNR